MQYVKLALAINDEDYETELAVWDKYYDKIANKNVADNTGYFWAVTEAKAIEGSAVPIGSNQATPTHDIKVEPPEGDPLHHMNPLSGLARQGAGEAYYRSVNAGKSVIRLDLKSPDGKSSFEKLIERPMSLLPYLKCGKN